ncbi:MAG: YceI family protein [Planctomycetota bacterium]|nr:YceI family protein [Planctomycetota bacterium]
MTSFASSVRRASRTVAGILALCGVAATASAVLSLDPTDDAPKAPAPTSAEAVNVSPAPPRASSRKSLVVPDEHKKLGTVFAAISGGGIPIRFTSTAPLETIKGSATDVVGYAVAGPADNPANLQAGAWRLGVASMKTGIEARDQHLAGSDWLDAAAHPDIIFQLTGVENLKVGKVQDSAQVKLKQFNATLNGVMTIKGVSRAISIPQALITLVEGNDTTLATVGKGNILTIQCSYRVTLSEFGVKNRVISEDKKVAEVIDISTRLTMSDVMPEDQPERAAKPTPPTPPAPPAPSEKK